MSKLYWNNNGTTCCFPLTSTQPSGHYLGVNVSGSPQYVKLSAGVTSALNINIGGTQYGAVSYPETTDILVTSDFVCKRTATTEALCIYANGTQILNTAGTACCPISIPDNATIVICGPVNACYLSATMQDGYYAANVTRSCACISMTAGSCTNTLETNSCACIYGEYDWEQSIDCQTWAASCPVSQCFGVYGTNLTGTHTISGTITSYVQSLSCATTCSFTLPSGTHNYSCITPMATGSLTGDATVGIPFCSCFKLNGANMGAAGCGTMCLNGSYTSFSGYCDANTKYFYCFGGSVCCCFGTYSFSRVYTN